jgi:putative inorganic carbon (hco3(-)) transporter
MGADVQAEISERVGLLATGHLSRREMLWRQAIEMGLAHPWLGAGPMHFAALESTVAAHPHNLVLQWFAELGLPSLILLVSLVMWAGIKAIATCNRMQQGKERLMAITLLSALAGMVTNAMTDGLHVMPYTQTCLAVVIGWLIGLQPSTELDWKGPARSVALPPLVVLVVILVVAVAKDLPELRAQEEAFLEATSDRLQPRFWRQGRIQW